MADTSLVFNIIARDSGVGRALTAVQRAFRGAGQEAESSLGQAASSTENLDRSIQEVSTRIRTLSEEFERTGDKKLFGQISRDRSLVSNLEKIRSTLRDTGSSSDDAGSAVGGLGGIFGRVSGAASDFGGRLSGMVGQAQAAMGPYAQLAMTLLQIAGAAAAAGPAIYAVGGAAAAIPGLLSGAIAALFTLKLGMSGLGENWAAMNKPAGGGGGGGGSKAPAVDPTPKIRAVEAAQRQVAKSTRDITDAQKDLKEATDAVNKAREEELERIEDLTRSLRGAKIDEREATQGLLEAQQELANAQARGNPESIMKAQLALEKQQLALDESKDKVGDLQKETDDAAKKGVEGSDAVVQAKKREQDAQRAVQDAVEQHKLALQQLGDAQKSLNEKIAGAGAAAAGGLGVQLPKIAKSAQEFLNELKRLKPAFDDLRLDIQQRLFEGLAGKLRTLAQIWIPALHKSLGDMADTINGVVKTAFDSLSKPDFVKNMQTGIDAFRIALGDIGQAIAGPLVDAWGRLSAAASPFIIMLGDKIAGIVEKFSAWIKSADESGKLQAFMEKATHIVGKLFDILVDLARIGGAAFSIFTGGSQGKLSGDAFDSLADGIHRFADWLNDPKTQQSIQNWMEKLYQVGVVGRWLWGVIFALVGAIASMVGWFLSSYDTISTWWSNLPETIGTAVQTAIDWVAALPGRIGEWLSQLPGVISTWVSNAAYQLGYWMGWGIGWLIKQLIELPGRIWGVLKQLPGLAKTGVTNFVTWLGTLPGRAWDAVKSVGSWVISAVSDLPRQLYNAGINLVVGLWNGIAGAAGWLWDKASSWASGFKDGILGIFDIHSPSRWAEKMVGRQIIAGIAAGMDDHTDVMSAADRLAQNLAGTRMSIGGVDADGLQGQLLAAADSVVRVTAAKKQEQVVRLVIDGSDDDMVKMIRKWDRTRGGLLPARS